MAARKGCDFTLADGGRVFFEHLPEGESGQIGTDLAKDVEVLTKGPFSVAKGYEVNSVSGGAADLSLTIRRPSGAWTTKEERLVTVEITKILRRYNWGGGR